MNKQSQPVGATSRHRQIKRRALVGALFIARSALVTAASALRLLTRIPIEQRLRLQRKPVSDNTMISITRDELASSAARHSVSDFSPDGLRRQSKTIARRQPRSLDRNGAIALQAYDNHLDFGCLPAGVTISVRASR